MFHLHIEALDARRTGQGFVRAMQHLRQLGCDAVLHVDGDELSADIALHDAPNEIMQHEIRRALGELSGHIGTPGRVRINTDRCGMEYFVGTDAAAASRELYLRRAALYAD